MNAQERGPAGKQKPRTVHTRTTHYRSTATLPSHHRWQRRPHLDGWDVAVWVGFTLFCAMLIVMACAVVWVVAS